MLNDLENVINNFFTQYGFTIKSSNSRINADQVARLLADQIFLHIIATGTPPLDVSELSSKPTGKPRKSKEKQPDKPKRKYQRKPNATTEIVEGTEGAV